MTGSLNVPLFRPVRIGPLDIANRIVVAPMCQYSATDGAATDWHRMHLSTLALSGAGLVTVEATAPEPRGRITHHCLGLYSDATEAAFADVLATVRAVSDVPLAIQIGHAGRKASSQRPWEGRGALGIDDAPWQTLSPMDEPLTPAGPATRAMTRADMDDVLTAHVDAVVRAVRLGFDMIELHAGHGYLLSSFLSPLTNRRGDIYGGSAENRLRFPLEVVRAMRAAVPPDRSLAVKYNGTDWAKGGLEPADAPRIALALADAGVDMVTLTGGGVVVLGGKVPTDAGYQLESARRVMAAQTGMVVGAVGMIYDARFANGIIESRKADVVSIARAMLDDPRWPLHAAAVLDHKMSYPPQYARAAPHSWSPARPTAD